MSATRGLAGGPVAASCHLLPFGDRRRDPSVGRGEWEETGNSRCPRVPNQLALYVCVHTHTRAHTSHSKEEYCARTGLNLTPLPSTDHLDFAKALPVALWDKMLQHFHSLVSSVSFPSIFLLMRITIGFVQMRKHSVFPCKEPEAIHHIEEKIAGRSRKVFPFLSHHTNMRSETHRGPE